MYGSGIGGQELRVQSVQRTPRSLRVLRRLK
jgi:hypothetical protein